MVLVHWNIRGIWSFPSPSTQVEGMDWHCTMAHSSLVLPVPKRTPQYPVKSRKQQNKYQHNKQYTVQKFIFPETNYNQIANSTAIQQHKFIRKHYKRSSNFQNSYIKSNKNTKYINIMKKENTEPEFTAITIANLGAIMWVFSYFHKWTTNLG